MSQLFELAVVLGDLMNARLIQHGLTAPRAEVLWGAAPGWAVTQRELSQILECTPRNVNGLVDALLEARLVNRVPHRKDRRAVQVSLSKQGLALLAEWGAEREHGAAQILGNIAPTDLVTFTNVLDNILDNLRSAYSLA